MGGGVRADTHTKPYPDSTIQRIAACYRMQVQDQNAVGNREQLRNLVLVICNQDVRQLSFDISNEGTETHLWEKLLANELDADRSHVVGCIGIDGIGGF